MPREERKRKRQGEVGREERRPYVVARAEVRYVDGRLSYPPCYFDRPAVAAGGRIALHELDFISCKVHISEIFPRSVIALDRLLPRGG